MKRRIIHRGQVALIMVLIMTVVSAVVVSIAGKTSNESNLQRLSKESEDAFLSAQEGLEDALARQSSVTSPPGDKTYTVSLENLGQTGLLTEKVNSGTSVDVVMDSATMPQGFKIYWKPATASPSSILVSKISSSLITEVAYDTLGANGFTKVLSGGNLNGSIFPYVSPEISLDSTVLRVRVTVLGGSTFLGIEPVVGNLPIQTVSYKAESSVGSSNGKVKYGLVYEESKDSRTPEVFDYALFSLGSIIQ